MSDLSRGCKFLVGTEGSERSTVLVKETMVGPDETVTGIARYSTDAGFRHHGGWFEDEDSSKRTFVIDPPEVILPARMVPGREYVFETLETIEGDDSRPFRMDTRMVLTGMEAIEVEAGRFEDCLRVEVVSTASEDDVFTSIKWFAPEVGAVLIEWESKWGAGRAELVSFSQPE